MQYQAVVELVKGKHRLVLTGVVDAVREVVFSVLEVNAAHLRRKTQQLLV